MLKSCVVLVGLSILFPVAYCAAGDVKLTQDANHISVTIDGKPFTDYWFGPRNDRPYVRPFFVPVLAADGTPVTVDHYGQKEHPHHQSLWVGHGAVNGADHWTLHGDKSPKQRHIKFEKVEGDTAIEDLEWEGKNLQPILRERRTMRFIGFDDGSRGIELTLEFTPTDGAVDFEDTKEAGLVAIRVAKSISDAPTITTSAGVNGEGMKGEKAAWGKPADWCDISGQINGKPYGIAAFDAPANPLHPTRWHVRAYGLLAANPFGLSYFDKHLPRHAGDFVMQPGKTVTFRYEVVVHEGDAASAKLPEKYKQFAGGK